MKLRKLYSDKPSVFQAIEFNSGISAILAEIRVPANRQLDTHNLGKTTVGELIEFCLLKGKDANFFLYKDKSRFEDFTFFLEIELAGGSYLTIGRAVTPGSRVDFMESETPINDVTLLKNPNWEHKGVPFERARLVLDGLAGINALRPWGLRKVIGYLIRSQRDYLDVFQLGKFSGKHQDWKPFVAHLLGMEAQPVIDLYAKREEAERIATNLSTLTREWGGDDVDPSVLDGLISVKRRDAESTIEALESFNFRNQDVRITADVVDGIEKSIIALNEESYRLSQTIQLLSESLTEGSVSFRAADSEKLFREAGVAFGKQVKREYTQLTEFVRAITAERKQTLEEQLTAASARLREIESDLVPLNQRRAESLTYLREGDSLAKFKELTLTLTALQADLNTLEAKRAAAARLIELRRQQRALAEEYGHLENEVESQIASISGDEQSRFGQLRRHFTDIVFEVLGQNAIIAIKMNKKGGLEFTAEFIGDSGTATSGDKGTSYRKLLCIAFDLAMLRTYLDVPFPRFVYHDGALEQLEPRKQEKLLGVFRSYAQLGIQPVISLLDSDLPAPLDSGPGSLVSSDVVLELHDEGETGRLFRMATW